jgi:hypothetical protein
MNPEPDAAFEAWLDALLSERKAMRDLLALRYKQRAIWNDTPGRQRTEVSIRDLVVKPLGLTKRDMPLSWATADAAEEVLYKSSAPEMLDMPELIFSRINWNYLTNHAAQTRVLTICGPLEWLIANRRKQNPTEG